MDVTLNPFTFTFSNTDLERTFVLYQGYEHLCIEKYFVLLDVVLVLAFGISKRCPNGWPAFVMISSLISAHWIQFVRTRTEVILQYRFWTLLAFRSVRFIIFRIVLPLWVVPSISESFLVGAALRSGIITLIWHGIGLQTRFREFILLQGIFSFVVAVKISRPICLGLLEHPDSEDIVLQVWRLVLQVWRLVHSLAIDLKEIDYPSIAQNKALEACSFLLTAAHFPFSFVLPTFVVWILEIRSRCYFLASLNRSGSWMGFRLETFTKPIAFFHSSDLIYLCV